MANENQATSKSLMVLFYFLLFLPSIIFALIFTAAAGIDNNAPMTILGEIKWFSLGFLGTSFPIIFFILYASLKNLLNIPALERNRHFPLKRNAVVISLILMALFLLFVITRIAMAVWGF